MKYLIVFIALCFIVTAKDNGTEMGLQSVPLPVAPAVEARQVNSSKIVPSSQKVNNSGNAAQDKGSQEPSKQIKPKAVPAVVTQDNSTKLSNIKGEATAQVVKEEINETKSELKYQQSVSKQIKAQENNKQMPKKQSPRPQPVLDTPKTQKNVTNNINHTKQQSNMTNNKVQNMLQNPNKQKSKIEQTKALQIKDKNEEKIIQISNKTQVKIGKDNQTNDKLTSPPPILVTQEKNEQKTIQIIQQLKKENITQPKIQSKNIQKLIDEHELKVQNVSLKKNLTQIPKIQLQQSPKKPQLQPPKEQLKDKPVQANQTQIKKQSSQKITNNTIKESSQIIDENKSAKIQKNIKIQQNTTQDNAATQIQNKQDQQTKVKIQKNVSDSKLDLNNSKQLVKQQQSQRKEIAKNVTQQYSIKEKADNLSLSELQIKEEKNKTQEKMLKNQNDDQKILIDAKRQEQNKTVQVQKVRPLVQSNKTDKVDDIKNESKLQVNPVQIVANVQPSEKPKENKKESENIQTLLQQLRKQLQKMKQAKKKQDFKSIEPIIQEKTSLTKLNQVKKVEPIKVENEQSPNPIIIDTQPAKDEQEKKQSQSNIVNDVQKLKGEQLLLRNSTKTAQQIKVTEAFHKNKIANQQIQPQHPKSLQQILVVKSTKKQESIQKKQEKMEQVKPKLKAPEANVAQAKRQIPKVGISQQKKQLSQQQDQAPYQKKTSRINNKPSRENDDNIIIVALVAGTSLLVIFFVLRSLKTKQALQNQGESSHSMFRQQEDLTLSGPEIAERLQD